MIKKYNWYITVGAVEMDKRKALSIAKILFDEWDSDSIKLKNIINKPNE